MKITAIDTKKKGELALKRVAGYARVSVDTFNSAHSLDAQSAFLKKRIASTPGWVDGGVFLDLGITGTKTDRPGFRALMEKCDKGELDVIVTKSISRFCRNTVDLLATVRHLKDLGVEVIFDENNISTFSYTGEMVLTFLASQAQEESRSISENVLWSIKKKFERGEGIPHDLLGYRWNGSNYEIVDDEAKIVREIFSMYMTGLGPKEISRVLRKRGIKGLRGSPMSANTVTHILRQEKYMGDSILQKTFTVDHISHLKVVNRGERDRYYAEETHPPIITKEEFDEVQEEIERRKNAGSLECNWKIVKSPFTSKVICSECGRTFRRRSNKQKNGKIYYKWTCGERIDKRSGCGCTSKSIPEWALYSLTAEILGKENFTSEDFDESLDHILGGSYHEITFVMKDGREITRKWKNQKGAEKCLEK